MSKLKRNYYFLSFADLVKYTIREAELLNEIILNYDNIDLEVEIKKMHDIEHMADTATHGIVIKLAKEFITPIEREDIISICQKIDNVTDAIEDVLLRFYMYNIKKLRPNLSKFSLLLIDACRALEIALEEFPNFKKSTQLQKCIVEVNNIEEKADALYTSAVRELFIETNNPIELTVWEEIYLRFENCFDACENVVNAMESVIMKNI